MTTSAETIGRRIAEYRQRSGLLQSELALLAAELSPMTAAALLSIENGDRLPTSPESLAIATALKIAPTVLLYSEPSDL